MKIVITGVPHSGKTTLALQLSNILELPVYHSDDLRDMDWSTSSEEVSYWFDKPDSWIIEGVTVARSLKKWVSRNPNQPFPFDRFLFMRTPLDVLHLPGLKQMATRVINECEAHRELIGKRWVEL